MTTVQRLFGGQFRNIVFVGVGEVDSALLKGPDEVRHLEQQIADDMVEYCHFAADLGFHPELRTAIGPDVVVELHRLCLEVAHEFPRTVFFAGKLIFTEELDGYVSRFLHNHTALEVQNWLQVHGLSLVILPVRVGPGAGPRGEYQGGGGDRRQPWCCKNSSNAHARLTAIGLTRSTKIVGMARANGRVAGTVGGSGGASSTAQMGRRQALAGAATARSVRTIS